jgi:hypothetical protein
MVMHPYFTEYLMALDALHADFAKQLDGLSAEGLDWSPGEGFNSLAVLAAHLAGSQKYWLGDVLSGRPSVRDRDAEFATSDVDAATLAAKLLAARADSTQIVSGLSLDSFAEMRLSPRHGCEYTVAWVLHHALEHLAQHVGHAQLTRQLWDQRQGSL